MRALRLTALASVCITPVLVAQTAPTYPAAPRGNQADDLGGIRVADPYRWLESTTTAEVRAWISAESGATSAFLSQLPRRSEIFDRVTRAWNYPKISAPFAAGDRVFFFENAGLENQPTLFVKDRPDAPARVLIDPNAFSNEGLIAIVDQMASPDGKYLAYTVSTQGAAQHLTRVRDVKTRQDVSEELRDVRDSTICWTKDERGFFYVRGDVTRAPEAALPFSHDAREAVLYHRVGRGQSDDQVVYESREHPDWRFDIRVSRDGEYLVIQPRAGVALQNRLYLIDLDNPGRPNLRAPLVKLFDGGDALYDFVANDGPVFYVRTTNGAPHARLVAVDINMPDPNRWTPVLRETYDPLVDVRRVDDRFIAHRLRDAHSVLEIYSLDGGVRGTVPLPGVGTVTELNPHPENRQLFFTYSSVLQAPEPYRYELDSKNTVSYEDARPDTALSKFETTQLLFTSKDGTRVSMFLTARRGITLDGSHPTLLEAGSGFAKSMTPVFSPEIAAWLQMGGTYAVANVRGGGEYGRQWHDAAMGAKKQVAIDDYIAAAEFLIGQRYTRPPMLAATGRGHGAMLAAAAVAERPKLFGAAALESGLFDMARFTRSGDGASWVSEYGSPDRPSDLRALLAYSPLHAVDAGGSFPAAFLTVGDHDQAIAPSNSYKLTAALQRAAQPAAPALLLVEPDAALSPWLPTMKAIALSADRLTFLAHALGLSR